MPLSAALGRWRQKDEELKVSLNNIGSLRQPGLQDTLSSGEKRGKKKEGTGPTLGLGYICSRRSSFHFKAQLPSICMYGNMNTLLSL